MLHLSVLINMADLLFLFHLCAKLKSVLAIHVITHLQNSSEGGDRVWYSSDVKPII